MPAATASGAVPACSQPRRLRLHRGDGLVGGVGQGATRTGLGGRLSGAHAHAPQPTTS
nr:hypothetical protein [Angustibacter aerolatus]